jgi:hypothetical protein
MDDLTYIKTLPIGVQIVGSVAYPKPADEALRIKPSVLRRGAQKLCEGYVTEKIDFKTGEITIKNEFRLTMCCTQPVDDFIPIYKNLNAVGFSKLMRCGCVWGCPTCCAKVMRFREAQIHKVCETVQAQGGSLVLLSLTCSSSLDVGLIELFDVIKKTKLDMIRRRGWKKVSVFWEGDITATEITYSSQNGWHPHFHLILFFKGKHPDCNYLADLIFDEWEAACIKNGLTTQKFYKNKRVGVDVRPAWDASEYLTKFDRVRTWSLPSEVTAGRLKRARQKSLTPWAILEQAMSHGPKSRAAELWIEYLRATKRKSVISVKGCKKLLERLGMPMTLNDLEAANDKGQGEIIANLSRQQFSRAVFEGRLGQILEAARSGKGLNI